jgi:hypothetical protein
MCVLRRRRSSAFASLFEDWRRYPRWDGRAALKARANSPRHARISLLHIV